MYNQKLESYGFSEQTIQAIKEAEKRFDDSKNLKRITKKMRGKLIRRANILIGEYYRYDDEIQNKIFNSKSIKKRCKYGSLGTAQVEYSKSFSPRKKMQYQILGCIEKSKFIIYASGEKSSINMASSCKKIYTTEEIKEFTSYLIAAKKMKADIFELFLCIPDVKFVLNQIFSENKKQREFLNVYLYGRQGEELNSKIS